MTTNLSTSMVYRRCIVLAAAATLVGAFTSGAASAAVNVASVSSTASQSVYDAAMSATDLGTTATMTGTTPSLGSLNGLRDGLGSPTGTSSAGTLTNNSYLDGTAGFGTKNLLLQNPTATFTFNTGAGGSAAGYRITSIVSTNGWHDHASMSNQVYAVAYSTVANPTTFLPLTNVAYAPFDPASDTAAAGTQFSSSQVTITDTTGTLANGVAAIRFTFSPYFNASNVEQAGQLIREIDIIGVPTVPEPTTAVVSLGIAAGVLRRRRVAR